MNQIRICNCSTCVEKRLCDANIASETKLVHVRRVAVEGFSGDPRAATPAQEILIAALCATKRWVVMEHASRADAVFKGHIQVPSSQSARVAVDELGLSGGDSLSAMARMAVMAHVGRQEEVNRNRQNAELTIRLTTQSGIVLWATNQTCGGGKNRNAVSEMVERAVRQLVRTIEWEEEELAPVPESLGGLAALGRVLNREDEMSGHRAAMTTSA